MKTIDLSGIWRLALSKTPDEIPPEKYTDTICLPDTVSHAKKVARNNDRATGHLTDHYSYEGYAWFSREFTVSEEDSARELSLFLERTRMTEVFLDGKKIGSGNSLTAPHIFVLPRLEAGVHTLAVRVANVGYPTGGGHLTSPDTQTNWLGITGKIRIISRPAVHIDEIMIFPDCDSRELDVTFTATGDGTLSAFVQGCRTQTFGIKNGKNKIRYVPDKKLPLWDEFDPNVFTLSLVINGEEQRFPFGFRRFAHDGLKLYINGNETFLRGKHDGMVFPLTGYAPTDTAEWERVFGIAKAYGINHYRFHTCCPPEAAFSAADKLGIYLQPELPFWGTIPDEINEEQQYLIDEGFRMLAAFGNHPSFAMMSLGNELWGSKDVLNKILHDYRAFDNRHLYTDGSNNFQFVPEVLAEADFLSGVRLSRERLYRGSYAMCDAPLGHIQTDAPNSRHNYDSIIKPEVVSDGASEGGKILIQYGTGVKEVEADGSAGLIPDVPVISHEIGQYETYPDYRELSHYTGSIEAENIAIYREKAEEKGLLPFADSFFRASGALAVRCYKAELETALRSENLSGFQLLDLQDFPGQGTALVGVLNSLMESKGLIAPRDWRSFCAATAVLAEFDKFAFSAMEKISFGVTIFNTDPNFSAKTVRYSVLLGKEIVQTGEIAVSDGERVRRIGSVLLDRSGISAPEKLHLRLELIGTEVHNDYDLWVYPELPVSVTDEGITVGGKTVYFAEDETHARERMNKGEKAIVIPRAEGKLPGIYCTDFWCYPMFKIISDSMNKPVAPGTMGCLIDEKHPALAQFPTEFFSTPQWYGPVMHSHCENLDGTGIEPIVWAIDNPHRAERFGILYEADGLLCCTVRLPEIAETPEGKCLAYSLAGYVLNGAKN